MKSAFELALERTRGELREIDDREKNQIAEIESKYKAKIAEAEIAAQNRIQKVEGNREEVEQIQNDLVVELASIRSKCEREKEEIRK